MKKSTSKKSASPSKAKPSKASTAMATSNGASTSSTSPSDSAAPNKAQERLDKLNHLRKRLMDAEKANRVDLFQEHERQHSAKDARDEQKAARKRREAEKLLEKREAQKQGVDLEREKGLHYTAEEVELWEQRESQKQERAQAGASGFADWAEANLRKHEKLFDKIQPDLDAYERNKERSAFHRDSNMLEYANPTDYTPSDAAVDRLVADMEEQQEKRNARLESRVKRERDDDITYINDRNRQFNRTIQRAFGKYSKEIKDSLERGTAL